MPSLSGGLSQKNPNLLILFLFLMDIFCAITQSAAEPLNKNDSELETATNFRAEVCQSVMTVEEIRGKDSRKIEAQMSVW